MVVSDGNVARTAHRHGEAQRQPNRGASASCQPARRQPSGSVGAHRQASELDHWRLHHQNSGGWGAEGDEAVGRVQPGSSGGGV